MKKLFTLIAAALLSTAAMADSDVFGAINKGWWEDNNNRTFTLAPNKTLTLDFVVNNTSKAAVYYGWVASAKDADKEYFFKQPNGFGVTEGNWEDTSKNTDPANTWYKCNFINIDNDVWIDEMVGAHVTLTFTRVDKAIRYLVDFKAANGAQRGQYFVMDNCGDGTQDITITLGADQAEIALNGSDIADSADPEVMGTLVGDIDNTCGFALRSQDFTLATNSEATLRFYNYGNRAANWYNWIFEAQKGDKYLDLRCDNWGWGDYFDGVNLTIDNYDWSTFKYDMYGAAVEIVVSRTGSTLNFKATQTATSGKVMTETYTVTSDDFAEGDITYRMLTEGCHLDIVNEFTTAIESVKAAKTAEAGVRYNLAGQKVAAGYKGVVIENGKKLVVK